MTEERFLWSAMCSANTTNATGMYATATVAIYCGLTCFMSVKAFANVKSGIEKNFMPWNTVKSIT